MNISDTIEVLESAGWICKRDEVGDRYCVKEIDRKVIKIFPTFKNRLDHFRVSYSPSVSTNEFSQIVSAISGMGFRYYPIIVRNESPVKVSSISCDDVLRLAEDCISWANEQDIERQINEFAAFPTDCAGTMPLQHLAALCILGRSKTLEMYQDSFKKGDRLNFVPYITQEVIDRALSICKDK